MGLAASQARFLCITARKADCEYKSTELAQQKLEITKQLSNISNEYSNAMNATKLMWSNEAVGADYGLTYGLLMMPSAINNYNPYMVTTPSGAIVLNNEYAAAAKAAGISKAGGIGSQASRDKFIQALVPGGLVTKETADSITLHDYNAVKNADNSISFESLTPRSDMLSVTWAPTAGMGREPLDKSSGGAMSFADLVFSESMGMQIVDWDQLAKSDAKHSTPAEVAKESDRYKRMIADVELGKVTDDIVNQLLRDRNTYKKNNEHLSDTEAYINKVKNYEELIKNAKKIMAGECSASGAIWDDNGADTSVTVTDVLNKIHTILEDDKTQYENSVTKTTDVAKVNTSANSLNVSGTTYSIVQNGVINHYKDEIENMTIGDILSGNIVLMANGSTSVKAFSEQVSRLLEYFSGILGYSPTKDLTGQGLNVDDASAKALEFAYSMVSKTFLDPDKAVNVGSRYQASAMSENSAYQNAVYSNRIGTDESKSYKGVSLSNMLSAFLTYYDNALAGISSGYVVGADVETSYYVTDNPYYTYIAQEKSEFSAADQKNADFFDQLYNNICEHGWREDAAIDDAEYLESAIKDGRYSMSSLNEDGYYYQTRYNETGYMVEVSDTDAIARAEAEFSSKKAELTYKEDSIDIKSKKVDAELSSLTTEFDTVKQLISKSIEKTFTLFSN